MLGAQGLSKRYGDTIALDGLNLSVRPSEVYCLLGANGAGKSTTIQLFLGLIQPSAGRAEVDGIVVAEAPQAARRRLAYIPEQVSLYPLLTGAENLAYFAGLSGPTPDRAGSLELFERVGLDGELADRRVASYSKGMRQKVGIAIALAKDAKALLLDEPLSGLDPKAANEFCALLTELREQGMAVLMATHDLFRARDTGTRVGIMRRGRLLEERRTDTLDHDELEQLYLELMRT